MIVKLMNKTTHGGTDMRKVTRSNVQKAEEYRDTNAPMAVVYSLRNGNQWVMTTCNTGDLSALARRANIIGRIVVIRDSMINMHSVTVDVIMTVCNDVIYTVKPY